MVFRPVISLVFHHFINLSCCHHHCYTTHWFSTPLSGARGVNWGECWKRKGEYQGRSYGRNSFLVPQSRWTKGKKNVLTTWPIRAQYQNTGILAQFFVNNVYGLRYFNSRSPNKFRLEGRSIWFWVRGGGGWGDLVSARFFLPRR